MADQFDAERDYGFDADDKWARADVLESLIQRGARDTAAKDGDWSTLIEPAELVDLAAEFVTIDDRERALQDAEWALRGYHVGWVTAVEAAAHDEAVERARALLASASSIDAVADALAMPDSYGVTREAAKAAAGKGDDHAAALLRDNDIDAAWLVTAGASPVRTLTPAHRRRIEFAHKFLAAMRAEDEAEGYIEDEMAKLKLATTDGAHVGLDLADPANWRDPANMPPAPDEPEQDDPSFTSSDRIANLCTPPGLVGEIVDWMAASSDRPNRALLLGAALTFVGTLAGRKFATPSNLRTNNYIVTLAPSGHGKDHALGRVKALATAAGLDKYVGPARMMSASALRKLVTREPSVGCYIDEFGGFMSQIHDRRAGLHNVMIRYDLLEMFSAAGTFFAGAEYAGEAASKVFAPNLSVSGTSTPDAFWSSLSSISASDGLLARLILLDVSGPKPARVKPQMLPHETPSALIDAVRRLADANPLGNLATTSGQAPRPITVPLDADAEAIDDERTIELDEAENDVSNEALPFLNRVREHALKLALVVAVGCDPASPIITGPILEWAYRLARLSAATLIRESADRIADNERAAAFNKILGLIKTAGDKGIVPSRIGAKAKGIDTRLRGQILDDLKASGRVRHERRTGAGRPSERYFFVA